MRILLALLLALSPFSANASTWVFNVTSLTPFPTDFLGQISLNINGDDSTSVSWGPCDDEYPMHCQLMSGDFGSISLTLPTGDVVTGPEPSGIVNTISLGGIHYQGLFDELEIDGNEGWYASDRSWCGRVIARCDFTGYWVDLVPALPEPAPFAALAAGIAATLTLRRRS